MSKLMTRMVGGVAVVAVGSLLVAGSATSASADAGSAVAAGLFGGAAGVMLGAQPLAQHPHLLSSTNRPQSMWKLPCGLYATWSAGEFLMKQDILWAPARCGSVTKNKTSPVRAAARVSERNRARRTSRPGTHAAGGVGGPPTGPGSPGGRRRGTPTHTGGGPLQPLQRPWQASRAARHGRRRQDRPLDFPRLSQSDVERRLARCERATKEIAAGIVQFMEEALTTKASSASRQKRAAKGVSFRAGAPR